VEINHVRRIPHHSWQPEPPIQIYMPSMATQNPQLSSRPQCDVCGTKAHLSRCSGCRVVWYCGREHQVSAWDAGHKLPCSAIKKARNKMEREEAKLHDLPNDGFMNNGDPFVNSVGTYRPHFCHSPSTDLLKTNIPTILS
jgi:hypothetical protein